MEGHIPDDSGTKTWPHQQELLGHLLQAPGPLPCHLERTFPWEKRGKGGDAGVELTPGCVLGLNPQERKTCQQVNYLICPQGHAFLLNYCLGGPGRCRGDRILQAHIWHIMDANGKLEDIINWEDCNVSGPCVRKTCRGEWLSAAGVFAEKGKIIRLLLCKHLGQTTSWNNLKMYL